MALRHRQRRHAETILVCLITGNATRIRDFSFDANGTERELIQCMVHGLQLVQQSHVPASSLTATSQQYKKSLCNPCNRTTSMTATLQQYKRFLCNSFNRAMSLRCPRPPRHNNTRSLTATRPTEPRPCVVPSRHVKTIHEISLQVVMLCQEFLWF